jgi:hypothetical protein
MVITSDYLDHVRCVDHGPRFIRRIRPAASRSGFHLYLNPVNWTILRDFPTEELLHALLDENIDRHCSRYVHW